MDEEDLKNDVLRMFCRNLVSAMRASWPATGTTLAHLQVFATPGDALAPGLRLLGGFDPADPFVAGKRGDIAPGRQCLRIAFQCIFEIFGKIVDDASGNALLVRHAHCIREPRAAGQVFRCQFAEFTYLTLSAGTSAERAAWEIGAYCKLEPESPGMRARKEAVQ